MYNNIVVAIDGSSTAEHAFREALKLVSNNTQITAVAVLDNPLQSYSSPYPTLFNFNEAHAQFHKIAENILGHAESEAMRIANIKIKTCLVDMGQNSGHNDIAPAITKVADDYHADLIVIGTHGRSGIKRFFLGSVAEQLIHQSRLPVLIIRSPDADNELIHRPCTKLL